MSVVRDELRAWLAPPVEPVGPTDLSDIGSRFVAINAPARQAAEMQRQWERQSASAIERLRQALVQMGEAIRASDMGSGELEPGPGAYAFLQGESRAAGERRKLWSHASGSIVTRVTDRRRVKHRLYSGGGVELYEGGQLRIVVGHFIVWSTVEVPAGHRAATVSWHWSDERWTPVGSAQQQRATSQLSETLISNLSVACEELVRRAVD